MTTKHKAHVASSDSNKKTPLQSKTALDPEIFDSIDKEGYGVPRIFPYTKLTIEGTVEMCIHEFNGMQHLLGKRLHHAIQGLLMAMDFATSSNSWKNHSLEQKDIHRLRKLLKNAMNFEEALETPASHPERRKFTPFTFTLEGESIIAHFPEEVPHFFNAAVAFPYNEDRRQRFAYAVRLLSQMTTGLRANKSMRNEKLNYFEGQTDDEIHEEWIYALRKAANPLSYIVNSSSWHDNELASFDLMELSMKTRL